MRDDWEPVRLGDLVAIEHGWPFKSEEFSEELTGRPIVVAIGNFRYDGGFRFETTTTKEYRGDYPRSYELLPGDTLLIMTCQTSGGEILGIPARVPDDDRVYLHNQRLGKVVVRVPDRIDSAFLYHLFRSRDFNQALCATASGSKILHTAPSRIEAYEFRCPPIGTQREIAAVLGSLEDKIELNQRTNRAAEGLARAIFKAWFVDFEPVKAKEAGAPGFPGMTPATFDGLPERLTDSLLGPAPQGWQVQTVGDVATLSKQQINPQDYADELFEHFSIPAYDAGQNPVVEPGSGIMSQKFVVVPGCVLLSKLNPRIPRVWIPAPPNGRRQIASTEFLVAVPKPEWSREFLYCLFQQEEFRDNLAQSASGTSNSHQRVRPSDLLARAFVVPPKAILDAFNNQVVPQMALREALQAESSKLVALRDYLLPRLLSGRATVRRLQN